MERLAALVPRPRLHLIGLHGVVAPNAKLRSKIVPAPTERATEPPTDHAQGQGETPRMNWTRLLKGVFDSDIEHCPNCAGALKIIAAIEAPPVIIKILSPLGLPTRAPPRARLVCASIPTHILTLRQELTRYLVGTTSRFNRIAVQLKNSYRVYNDLLRL
jgi:hypothetical protein